MNSKSQINRRSLSLIIGNLGVVSLLPSNILAQAKKLSLELKLKDKAKFAEIGSVKLKGWLGERFKLNAKERMMKVDTDEILAGYKTKPGAQAWVGEHIGKYIHAATLVWVQTQDSLLKRKLDAAVKELVSYQETDGYLGTYTKDKRFGMYHGADWDVWSHKYCIIGLLTYYKYTKYEPALVASKRAADLLIATFPSSKSINAAGAHEGMAATSVLDAIILLYENSGDEKYLVFAKYIVSAMDEKSGPELIQSLKGNASAYSISNGKAYEMLSNFYALARYAKIVGDREIMDAIEIVWQDIASKRLYITGTASSHEHFKEDYVLPEKVSDSMGETCVTTTWIQLCQTLLEHTANVKYANEIERSFYNHLTAAQSLNGNDWCYYTPLDGKKPFDKHVTCCHSSGPRGIALSSYGAVFTSKENDIDYINIASFESLDAEVEIGGTKVKIRQSSTFPYSGSINIFINSNGAARFGIKIRNPDWAQPINIYNSMQEIDGWLTIPPQTANRFQMIKLDFSVALSVNSSPNYNNGKKYLRYGPFVLARVAEEGKTPKFDASEINNLIHQRTKTIEFKNKDSSVHYVAFADVGNQGEYYTVWH